MGGLIGVVTKDKDGLYDKEWMIPRGVAGTVSDTKYRVSTLEELQDLPLGTYAIYGIPPEVCPISNGLLIKGSGYEYKYNNAISTYIIAIRDSNIYYCMKWNDWSRWYKITTTAL